MTAKKSTQMRACESDTIVIPELEEAMARQRATIWSPEEIKILKKYYGKAPASIILKHLSGKTLNMLYLKAANLDLVKHKGDCE